MADCTYEPIPRWSHVAIAYNGKVYVWGGRTKDTSLNAKLISVVEEFDPITSKWMKVPTRGEHPQRPERCAYTCTEDGSKLYVFGGYHEGTFSNSLYCLALDTMSWEEISCCDPECFPGKKAAAGMVIWNNDTLVLFGGYGLPPIKGVAQDTAYLRNAKSRDGSGWTNELHLFKLSERSWTFQPSKGTPPPCNGFSFVLFSKDNVLRFGGNEPKKECVNRLDILDLTQWSWNEVNIDGGLVPEGRKFHSTACITTDPGSPKLLIIGGTLQNRTVSGEVWILDYHAKRWMMVDTMSEMKRFWHTATCLSHTHDSTVIQVVGFGGSAENVFPLEPISETIVFDIDTTSMTVRRAHGVPLLQHLLNDVAEVIPAKWRAVGIQLKLSTGNLDNIESENRNCNKHCFEHVFKEWSKQYPQSYSWTKLIEALETLHVGENALADALCKKHLL